MQQGKWRRRLRRLAKLIIALAAICSVIAWHDTIVGKDVDKEFDAIDKLDRAIESSGMAS